MSLFSQLPSPAGCATFLAERETPLRQPDTPFLESGDVDTRIRRPHASHNKIPSAEQGSPMRNSVSTTLVGLGWLLGGINYLMTAYVFFSRGNGFLGLVQLIVPPAELVLPWIADRTLGIVSVISIGLVIAGAAVSGSVES